MLNYQRVLYHIFGHILVPPIYVPEMASDMAKHLWLTKQHQFGGPVHNFHNQHRDRKSIRMHMPQIVRSRYMSVCMYCVIPPK